MNAKIYSTIIGVICGLSLVGAYIYYDMKPTEAIMPQCTIENPVGCDEQIEKLTNEYNKLAKQQSELSKKADVYRAIKRLELSPTTTGETEKLNESS